jgi:hypothetical protein
VRTPSTRSPALAALALVVASATALAACGDDDDAAPATTAVAAGTGALAGICPDPVVIQTDWHPQSEHGAAYELLGEDYTVDVGASAVRGPLVDADGTATGVTVEVRTGGPAIGFQTVTSQLHQDPGILLGFVNTAEAVANAGTLPTVSVLAPLEKNPQILMWNPERFPGVETIDEMPDDTLVVAYGPATYLEWLVAEGLLRREQIDGSYDASAARFAAEDGGYLQQGFATAEPYIYEFEIEQFAKPVAYQLIHDMGFEQYSQALAATPANLEEHRACLAELVPIYQAAQVAYVADPARTNSVILDAVETLDNGWVYSAGVAEFSVEAQLELGVIGNGPDGTLGNFDLDRVRTVLEAMVPILEARGTPAPTGLSVEDLVTNEFVDPSIGLR